MTLDGTWYILGNGVNMDKEEIEFTSIPISSFKIEYMQ